MTARRKLGADIIPCCGHGHDEDTLLPSPNKAKPRFPAGLGLLRRSGISNPQSRNPTTQQTLMKRLNTKTQQNINKFADKINFAPILKSGIK
ncbi:hypothetical protein [Magnetospirillum sp. 64-120]|uniref:hypothetical protein n=1 Tax=Magnetospirillum sp. 64-120 TaxID=1895778 RepID=UPI0025BE967C|nr:hypothetical protein [Magnetospirillum sp. 64-120]